MSAPLRWVERVQTYLATRRQAGYALTIEGQQLAAFARFAEGIGHPGPLTRDLALRWAQASQAGRPLTAARRIEILRGFARFWKLYEPDTDIPPLGLFGAAHRRRLPHIYTDQEVRDLLRAAEQLEPAGGLRAVSCTTVMGLLAATGLRISEATRLLRTDVDLDGARLQIRDSKFGKSRWVALHPTAVAALRRYSYRRDQERQACACPAFFVSERGRRLQSDHVRYAFRRMTNGLGWRARGEHPHVRLHDLRHTFICRRLQRWYEQGVDVEHAVLALSTYVGHAKVTDTYWYLSITPELMTAASLRFERFAGGSEHG